MKRYRVVFLLHNCKDANSYLVYQRYVLQGFRELPYVDLRIQPSLFSPSVAMGIRGYPKTGLNRLWRFIKIGQELDTPADHVGRYEISNLATEITKRVAIDAADGRWIRDPQTHEWSDVYFKNNYWPSLSYPSKVYPLANGDGAISPVMLKKISAMRKAKKAVDIYYLTRLWDPGSTSYTQEARRNIIEHQVRLYEALSKVRCTKTLAATSFESDLCGGQSIIRRLKSFGVSVVSRVPLADFYSHMASSRIVFVRPGDHLCISWRMCSFLNLGACIMYDGEPFAQWYAPLTHGIHFEHGGCRMGEDFSLPEEKKYDELTDSIQELLDDEKKMDYMRHEAAQYFDDHASPAVVARHILDVVDDTHSS